MHQTKLSIVQDKFKINDRLIYDEIQTSLPDVQGMLMNARFIQGIFDDKEDRTRYNRYGFESYDAEENTDRLIQALPEWYKYGLRGITVGFQGGGPCFTIDNYTIDANPYAHDGSVIDDTYLNRMKKIIVEADKLGMIVIVSLFYGAQTRFLENRDAIINAVMAASRWLREQAFTNIIIEIANEYDIACFSRHNIIHTEEGILSLIEIARRESGGMPIGCSGTGGHFSEAIAQASDVILIHANGQTRQQFYNLIERAKKIRPERPIVCNEDSQAISQLVVAYNEQVSWGYYNNMTKQEPPVHWGILNGEDKFFAYRMAMGIGIEVEKLEKEEQFYLQGFEKEMQYENKRWVRLASLYPENINYVMFYRNGSHFQTAYDDPFAINFECNWKQGPVVGIEVGEVWSAVIHLKDGTKVTKQVIVE